MPKQEAYKVATLDIAKRLIDNGFHPPTIYFPLVVHGALMIEPTETECKEDIDRFIETLKAIARGSQGKSGGCCMPPRSTPRSNAWMKPWRPENPVCGG
jgi:glycine cleavage system protein P-like pyridoxal-binding family